MVSQFSGCMTVQFRGTYQEILYRRINGDDVEWIFARDSMNDKPLTSQERRDIWREARGHCYGHMGD
jgi:hypothetical protein